MVEARGVAIRPAQELERFHEGSFVDGVRVSDVRLADLALPDHHSIKVRIGIKDEAEHVGGINVFGRGFGNYDQAIVLRLYFA